MRMIIIALRSGRPLRKALKHDIAHIASSITLASRVLAFFLLFFSLRPDVGYCAASAVCASALSFVSTAVSVMNPTTLFFSATGGSTSAWPENTPPFLMASVR